MKPCFYHSPGGGNSFQSSLSSIALHLREGRIASVCWIILSASLAVAQPSPEPSSQVNSSENSLPVLKQWHTLADGRMFLIESIGWTDAQPHVMALPAATQARNTPASKDNAAVARVWPERPISLAAAKPLEVARVGYQPKGYVVDFVIIPETGIRPPSSMVRPTTSRPAILT